MPSPTRLLLAAFLAAALGSACAESSPPPAVAPVSPKDYPRPILPPPPWQARLSAAEGYEAGAAAQKPVLIRNATLMLGTGKTIKRGSILLDKGKIAAIAEGDIPAPSGADVIDGAGKFVTPGLIDTHSHIGVYPMPGAAAHADGNEMTDPVTPQAQAVDAFWPQDPAIERAVAGGVTTLQALPGSGNLIGGRSVTVKLRRGLSPREMHIRGAPDGLKMACGENPKRYYGQLGKRAPMTRMGNVAGQRAAFLKAQKLRDEWTRWRDAESRRISAAMKKRAEYDAKREERSRRTAWCKEDPSREPCAKWRDELAKPLDEPEQTEPIKPPERDPALETLIAAMEGRVLVHVHCYRADDMLAMLALADEVGFRVRSFHHALEAYKIRRELAARSISTSTWSDWWGFKLEAYDGIPENIALIHESTGRAVVHSDSSEGIQRLNQEAAKALASGRAAGVPLTEEDAIRWVTIHPAWTLGIDHRTGSLEVGKDADVVLWSKSPLSVYGRPERVWIDGELVLDRASKGRPWSDFELGQDGAGAPPAPPVPPARPAPPAPPPALPPAPAPANAQKAPAGQQVIALVNALVHTGTGEILEDATVVIAGGKILEVGRGVAPPAGAEIIAVKGSVVTPGLVDPLTSIGLVEISLEKSTVDDHQAGEDKIRAGFRAADGYNHASTTIPVSRAEGITSAGVIPTGGFISGQSAWADLTVDRPEDALVKAPLAVHVHLEGGDDGGHATAILRVREAFDDARVFVKNRAGWERNQSRPLAPSRLDLEALALTLGGNVPVVFHVNRAADILAALGVAKEMGLRPIIAGGAEAWKVRGALAAAKTPVIVLPLESDPDSFDTLAARDDNAALLHEAGVPLAISTGSTHNARKLRQVAGNAVRGGLPHAAAIAAITRGAPDALGMGARYGTLAAGKVANVVVWSGDPLELSTRPVHVLVRGQKASLRSRQTELLDRYRRFFR